MSSRLRSRPIPIGFIAPCLPSKVHRPPTAGFTLKYDGFRLLAWRQGERVRLFTRRGLDWTEKFPEVARAVAARSCRTCLIDGEVVACDEAGVLRSSARWCPASLHAFDPWSWTGPSCAGRR